jgi:NAD(P)-dependent dehydrogenase (short-subunit alcohol dehydrogenase family)
MEPKNILITGCSSGIGKNAAITLHNKGWRVFATCRSKNDCNFFKNLGIESFELDLQKKLNLNLMLFIIMGHMQYQVQSRICQGML